MCKISKMGQKVDVTNNIHFKLKIMIGKVFISNRIYRDSNMTRRSSTVERKYRCLRLERHIALCTALNRSIKTIIKCRSRSFLTPCVALCDAHPWMLKWPLALLMATLCWWQRYVETYQNPSFCHQHVFSCLKNLNNFFRMLRCGRVYFLFFKLCSIIDSNLTQVWPIFDEHC